MISAASFFVRLAALSLAVAAWAGEGPANTFTNPILPGADPWLVNWRGEYVLAVTRGNRVELRRSRTLAGLRDGQAVTIWHAHEKGPCSRDIWAPEIHFIDGRWYAYFAATTDDRSDANRRIFVLASDSDDPLGSWHEKGRLVVPENEDEYAIDATVFRHDDGKWYMLWSGRERSEKGPQNIYIARMTNPWTAGRRVRLSQPDKDWEKHGWWVNEGPQFLKHGDKMMIVYSGSGFLTPNYCLGLLIHNGGDLLDSKSWSKYPEPVFAARKSKEGDVYAPGHCSFFKSPDDTEDWIIYHARDTEKPRGNDRTVRAQHFAWKSNNTPDFDVPVAPGVHVPVPAGENTSK